MIKFQVIGAKKSLMSVLKCPYENFQTALICPIPPAMSLMILLLFYFLCNMPCFIGCQVFVMSIHMFENLFTPVYLV